MATREPENRRVAVVGLEGITSTEIYSLFVSGRIRDVVLAGAGAKRLIREFRELHAMVPLSTSVNITQGTIEDCARSEIAVIAGSAHAGCGTLVSLRTAVEEIRRAVVSLERSNFSGVILVIGSPIELLVRVAVEASAFPKEKVFGIGNRTDLGAVVSRISGRSNTSPAQLPINIGTELPKDWCTASSIEVRYIDSCSADCPFFESLIASPSVARAYVDDSRPRSPQKLAACVTQVCESVVDDLHTAASVFVYKDGVVAPHTCVITRDGLANGLPNEAQTNSPRERVAADAIWSMVNTDRFVQARGTQR